MMLRRRTTAFTMRLLHEGARKPSESSRGAARRGAPRLESLTRAPATYEVATSPVASPTRRAVEHDCARVCVDGADYFLSRRTEDAADFVDVPDSVHAARQAAAAGVAPAVIEELAEVDSVVYEHLPEGVRWARNDDLAQVDLLARVIAAKKLLHDGPSMGRRRNVFGEIEASPSSPHVTFLPAYGARLHAVAA